MQKAIIILFALAASGQASFLSRIGLNVGLKVKFGIGFGSFFSVPLTIEQAKKEKWIETPQPDDVPELYKELKMYCFECDGPICALYEQHTGYVAGLQAGLNKETFYDSAYDLVENGFKEWTYTCNGVSQTLYTIRQYYMTEEFLSKSKADRISSYDNTKILQNGGVVTAGPGGELLLTTDDGSKLKTETVFTKQACIPSMGTHYYYNMSSATECNSKTMYPWFMLVHGDEGEEQQVIGCAMAAFGKVKRQAGTRDWFEHPPQLAVKAIVTDGPKCLYDMAKYPGAFTMHIYFVDSPRKILC